MSEDLLQICGIPVCAKINSNETESAVVFLPDQLCQLSIVAVATFSCLLFFSYLRLVFLNKVLTTAEHVFIVDYYFRT